MIKSSGKKINKKLFGNKKYRSLFDKVHVFHLKSNWVIILKYLIKEFLIKYFSLFIGFGNKNISGL
jgi:uncharacterized membrane protein (DUF485 family)